MSVGLEEFEGTVEKIVFFNELNSYCVASMKLSSSGKVQNISGILPSVQCGETLLVRGTWEEHKAYGSQFKVESFESKLPSSLYGIKKYLGSGLVEGVGKTYANKIVDYFKEDTLRVIDEDSARLMEVAGIGATRAKRIKQSWDEQRAVRQIVLQLRVYGVSPKNCSDIVKVFGDDAIDVIAKDPYQLARKIRGIGFKTADQIALNAGISNEGALRVKAGLIFSLSEFEDDGSTIANIENLLEKTAENLEVDPEICRAYLADLVADKDLVMIGTSAVQLSYNDRLERQVARSLNYIQQGASSLPPIDIDRAIIWLGKSLEMTLAPEQEEAVRSSLSNKISIITGGPGTGKTTVLRAITSILKAKKVDVSLVAPTGRAAQRMGESCSMPASTIHKLLSYNQVLEKFNYGQYKKLEAKFFIVDESSMLDTKLAASLFSAIEEDAHLVLVGDIDQLPSVGAGNILRDLMESKVFSTVRLERIFRQKEGSDIVNIAHDILKGHNTLSEYKAKSVYDCDFDREVNYISVDNPYEATNIALALTRDILPKQLRINPIRDIQFLVPMHKGLGGIEEINKLLQEKINPNTTSVIMGHNKFKKGDKLIQTRNNYDLQVYNGDMGILSNIDGQEGSLDIEFAGQHIIYEKEDATDLQLSYAISVHKSQGSEFPILILVLLKRHYMLLQRNLLYTAITRAKQRVFIIAESYAWIMCLENNESLVRNTALKKKIKYFYNT